MRAKVEFDSSSDTDSFEVAKPKPKKEVKKASPV